MTELLETIRASLKTKNAIMGYKRSIKFMRTETPKLVIIANNAPESMRSEIEHSTRLSNVPLEVFGGSSKDLGVVCGKPYPVTTIVIKE